MESRTATLIVRFKAADGIWKRCPAAYGGNGRVKPGYAVVNGKPLQVEDYQYQIRHYDHRKLTYQNAGKNASDAEALRQRIERQISATAIAEDAGLKVELPTEHRTLAKSAAAYIRDAEQRGASEAALQARCVSDEFMRMVKKTYVDEVTRNDIFRFHAALRKRSCSDRTVANKHARLASWLKFAGIDRGLEKNDPARIIPPKPKYEEALPTIYTSDEISTLLGEADPYMHMTVQMALKTGLRDGELMHLEFSDIDFEEKTLRVQGKPKWNFKVKTHEQRFVPVFDDVLDALKEWRLRREGQTLVLGTKNRQPNTKLLLAFKGLVRRAGLNCGRCDGCRERRECASFTLHKFRRTYITTLLRNGVDLRTTQEYAGHKDMKSTMRYLRPAAAKEAQAKLNAIKW